MARRKKNEEEIDSGKPCNWPDCRSSGNFRAPRSRQSLNDHQWLCQDHITEFNKKWNYFEGMGQDEIYAFQKDATIGHRPTWRMDQMGVNLDRRMEEAFARMFGGNAQYRSDVPPVSGKSKDALAVLDLEHPSDKKKIKTQYRALVKKYHPDVNRGNKQAEETFKKVTRAYEHLMSQYLQEKK